jgi:hypothetical protein
MSLSSAKQLLAGQIPHQQHWQAQQQREPHQDQQTCNSNNSNSSCRQVLQDA